MLNYDYNTEEENGIARVWKKCSEDGRSYKDH